MKRIPVYLVGALLLFAVSGCASLVVQPALDSLSRSLERQDDLELVREGAPALLLMIDGLITADPDNPDLLVAGAKFYSSYALGLAEMGDLERARVVSGKARTYGLALLKGYPDLAAGLNGSLADFKQILDSFIPREVAHLFWGGYGWGAWISLQDGAPAAMVELPKAEIIMLRVLELDETFCHGSAHIFLGAYYGSRPKMYGGRPEESRRHFEQALVISKRRYLPALVAYAETYARMTFDRELFESLLQEVLASPLEINEMTSSNQLARFVADKLLNRVEEFF